MIIATLLGLVMQSVLVRPQATVIQPVGSLSAANAIKFQHQLNAAVLSDKNASLLVDMGQVEFIDSAGLMALVSAQSMAHRLNKQFELCSVSRQVRMILELTQLDRVFKIFEEQATLNESAA
jgi:anti-anti-sigma factor